MSFRSPEGVRFRYRLDGFDRRWVEAGDRHEATYTRLAPGRYTYRVIARNADGLWSPRGDTVDIVLEPRFYQRSESILAGALTLIIALGGGYSVRVARLRARQQELERQVAERTDELSEANKRLAATADDLARANARLEKLATIDDKTGLLNFRVFSSTLGAEASRSLRTGTPLSLLMLDLDHFKRFNDTYGHIAGDDVLRQSATMLRDELRSIDLCFRYGGEELAVLLLDTPSAHAAAVAEKLRAHFAAASFLTEHQLTPGEVTVSIGVATLPGDADVASELVEAADRALYRAKAEGRNRVVRASCKHDRGPQPK
jgi:diguanylate cyclase (GGDEF)-like protein